MAGSKDSSCSENGQCDCMENIEGDKCDACKNGYFRFPDCKGKYHS